MTSYVNQLSAKLHIDPYDQPVYWSITNGAVQIVVPALPRQRITSVAHYHPMAWHSAQLQIHITIKRKFFQPHVTDAVYGTVEMQQLRSQSKLLMTVASTPAVPVVRTLEFASTAILGLLPKTTSRNQHVLVLTNSYLNLTRTIPSFKATLAHIANRFLVRCTISHGIPFLMLTNRGTQFVFKFFSTLDRLRGVIRLTTRA